MITNAVIQIIFIIVYGITAPLRLFEDVTLDNDFITSVTTASTYISAFDNFIPVTTLVTIFGIFLAFETIYFAYKLIMWLIKKIPTIN